MHANKPKRDQGVKYNKVKPKESQETNRIQEVQWKFIKLM